MIKSKRLLFILVFIPFLGFPQLSKYKTEEKESAGYRYETVTNDPLNARIYTLKNGLKVYMSVYKDAPRIQTYIAVRAGSKNDPADATGLAHYLEHMLFKGTSKIGTLNWEEEKKQLDTIEGLYEDYRKTVSDTKRKRLYREIDSVSQVAGKYVIANEYDKMLSNLGATGTNAYTFVEQTVYVNNIPANSLEKWAEIEAERFSMVSPRLFHTELEAVYEEKNRGLDNDNKKLWEATLGGLFPDHPYGTQTTIGTVEHLKNPSIKEIKKYFATHYVPANMAICLSGDLDPDKTIQILDKYFSQLKPAPCEPFKEPVSVPLDRVKEDTVWGPDAESVTIAFRFKGKEDLDLSKNPESYLAIGNTEPYLLKLTAMLLNNGQAGLIDLNLNQKQRVLSASAYDLAMNDHSMLVLSGRPNQGQSLEKTRDLLLEQLDSLKEGKFPDWLLKAVVNDIKTSTMRSYESNKARADAFVDAFVSRTPWNIFSMENDILESIRKEDIVDFVNKKLKENYLVVYKKTGEDKEIQKVDKPAITPVKLNRDTSSLFCRQVMTRPSEVIEPVFVDFSKDMARLKTKKNVPVLYKQNVENDLFSMSYVWEIGKKHDPKYAVATGYLEFLGTDKYTPEQLNQEFYKLGCSYGFAATDETIIFSLSGLNENFDKAYQLFEHVINSAKADEPVLKDYTGRILKSREDSKKSKDVIHKSALGNYVKYGPRNPFTNIVKEEELKALKGSDLTKLVKDLYKYEHRIFYYGPLKKEDVAAASAKYHKTGSTFKKPQEVTKYTFQTTTPTKVYFVDYDMVQAEVIYLSKSDTFNSSLTSRSALFNSYFGGGMGSLVFQEMRESKALAYSVKSSYSEAAKKDEPNYVYSYIGTQADKLDEAMAGMNELLDNMPKSELTFITAKTSVLENIRTQRITKSAVLWEYERLRKLGLSDDIRKSIFAEVQKMSFNDVKKFQEEYIKNQPKAILLIGSKKRINLDALNKCGPVQELQLKEIFGY
jgi:zinc protease